MVAIRNKSLVCKDTFVGEILKYLKYFSKTNKQNGSPFCMGGKEAGWASAFDTDRRLCPGFIR